MIMVNGESAAVDVELAAQLEQLRAENAALRDQLTAAPSPTGTPGRGRRVSSIICAVVGAILLPLAVITVWTRQTILDTDAYVATVAPLADDEDIQAAVTFQVTEAVAEAADFRSIAEEALPPNAAVLAGPIESGAKSLIQEVVARLVASDAFSELWEDVNRIGHDNVVRVLKGDGNEVLETSGGRIVLKLGPFAEEAIKEVDNILGTNLAETIPADDIDKEFVIVESGDLSDVQDALSLLDALSWITVILAIALLAAAVVLAENRRLGFRRAGVAIVAPMIIALVLYSWARGQYTDSLSANVENPDAATAFFDITTRFVLRSFRALLVLGLVFLIGAWVMGSSGSAAKVRAWWDQLLGRAGEAGAEREIGPVPRWVAEHQRALSIATVVVGALALVFWTRPTGWVVILLVVTVLLVVGAIRLVAEVGRRADLESIDVAIEAVALEEEIVEEEIVEEEIVEALVADEFDETVL
jgi:hypothetical protein